MGTAQTRRRRAPAIEPTDPRLLADPLAFLEAEHYRQRAVLSQLAGLRADAAPAARTPLARLLLAFLRGDLARHIADETADLMPVLRRRSGSEDGIEGLIEGTTAGHRRCFDLAAPVIAGLERIIRREPLQADFGAAVSAFVDALRRELAWQNAILFSFARKRLTSADRLRLGRAMAARRGIAFGRQGRRGYFGE
jgi:hypothetical protein